MSSYALYKTTLVGTAEDTNLGELHKAALKQDRIDLDLGARINAINSTLGEEAALTTRVEADYNSC